MVRCRLRLRLDLPPRSSWSTGGRVDEEFVTWVVRRRRRRRLHDGIENRVEVVGEMVATRIDIYGWRESLYEEGLLDASADPVMLGGEDGDILFAEVVAMFARVLEHGGLILPKSISGGGSVIPEAGAGGAFSFTDIPAWAWC